MVLDIWSRKILGWAVHADESMDHASQLIAEISAGAGVELSGWVLHSDNGGPMKGSTMLATLQRLGVVPSFSRPRVADDNPFSEALFRTMKYTPAFPSKLFESLTAARQWVDTFVLWYNHAHHHSAIRFVTPAQRHSGEEHAILRNRSVVYEAAKQRNPQRWSGEIRNWAPIGTVWLNPENSDAQAPGIRDMAA